MRATRSREPGESSRAAADTHVVECTERNANAYYRTGEVLRAKHRLANCDSGRHFHRWALALLPINPEWRVLDAGCGWGRFTWSLVDDFHLPPEHILSCDRSHGMLRTAQEEGRQRGQGGHFCVADIEALPLRSRAADLAVAGHVLYHLNDIRRGARELARTIDPDGFALVTTNSDMVNPLVIDLHYRALRALNIPFAPEPPSRFSMENGRQYLEGAFDVVETHYFEDSVTYQDVPSFVENYTTIGRYRLLIEDEAIPTEKRARLAAEVGSQAERVLAEIGVLRSPVLMGAFVCRRPMA